MLCSWGHKELDLAELPEQHQQLWDLWAKLHFFHPLGFTACITITCIEHTPDMF